MLILPETPKSKTSKAGNFINLLNKFEDIPYFLTDSTLLNLYRTKRIEDQSEFDLGILEEHLNDLLCVLKTLDGVLSKNELTTVYCYFYPNIKINCKYFIHYFFEIYQLKINITVFRRLNNYYITGFNEYIFKYPINIMESPLTKISNFQVLSKSLEYLTNQYYNWEIPLTRPRPWVEVFKNIYILNSSFYFSKINSLLVLKKWLINLIPEVLFILGSIGFLLNLSGIKYIIAVSCYLIGSILFFIRSHKTWKL